MSCEGSWTQLAITRRATKEGPYEIWESGVFGRHVGVGLRYCLIVGLLGGVEAEVHGSSAGGALWLVGVAGEWAERWRCVANQEAVGEYSSREDIQFVFRT